MATTETEDTKSTTRKPAASKASPKSRGGNAKSANGASATKRKPGSRGKNSSLPKVPTWVGIAASVGAGVTAGFFAWRYYQNNGSWPDGFSAAFADGETDAENFDQTRNAGAESMRTDHGDDWEDIDDMADASFPASDPPSFNPGTA